MVCKFLDNQGQVSHAKKFCIVLSFPNKGDLNDFLGESHNYEDNGAGTSEDTMESHMMVLVNTATSSSAYRATHISPPL